MIGNTLGSRNKAAAVNGGAAQRNHSNIKIIIVVALLIISALFLRQLSFYDNGWLSSFFALLRSFIYLGLFVAWGISVSKRIIQKDFRRYLVLISVIIVLWVALRTCKFEFLFWSDDITRLCWYAYYIPMLSIPLCSFMAAKRLGKPDYEPEDKRWRLLYIPTLILILLVMTNDMHQLAFVFPEGEIWSDNNYSYGPVCIAVVIWDALLSVGALTMMVSKSRLLRGSRMLFLPYLPLLLLVLYCICYALQFPLFHFLYGDMTIVICLLVVAIFESCIRCGLIQSNSDYEDLFRVSPIAACIADKNHVVYYASSDAVSVSEEDMIQAEQAPVDMPEGYRLVSFPISGGHVFWQEDVSKLRTVMDQLADQYETLQDKNMLLREEYDSQKRRRYLEEKNRLYDSMQKQTAGQIDLLYNLLEEFALTKDENKKRHILAKMTVCGAYLKRRNNLIFMADQNDSLPAEEMFHCFKESIYNLNLCNVECSLRIDIDGTLPAKTIMQAYDFFESVIELTLDDLAAILIIAKVQDDELILIMEVECESDLYSLRKACPCLQLDICATDEEPWRLTLRLPKGGAVA